MEHIWGALKFVASIGLVSVLTSIFGWFFVYKNSRLLQKRSETWSIVKNISDNLKEIEVSARKYWLPNDDKLINGMIFQHEVTSLLGETERWLIHLSYRIDIAGDYKPMVTDLFRDATADIEKFTDLSEQKRLRISAVVSKRTKIIKSLIDESYRKKFL